MQRSLPFLPTAVFALLLNSFAFSAFASPTGSSTESTAAESGQKKLPAATSQSMQLNEQGVQMIKAKDFIGAEETFRKALLLDAGNLTAAFNLSSIFIENKKENEAIGLLSSYVEKFPYDPGLFARLGDAFFAHKDIKHAIENYEKSSKLQPNFPGVASRLGTCYVLTNNLGKAEVAFLKAVELDPKNGSLLANLSNVFLANKKPEESISTAKRALQVTPNSALYVTLGNAYRLTKDNKNALISFQRAKDLGDKTPELQAEIDQMKKG